MANAVTAGSLYKFLSHKEKVLALYKKSLRHLEMICNEMGRHVYCYERTLLRARFDRYKDEKDFTKATQLLRLGEEEFWENQYHSPYLFPNEPEGIAYQRFWTYQVPEGAFDTWEPSERAHFPDYFTNRKKWYDIRKKTWSKEMECLREWDKLNEEAGVSMTDALPAAKDKDGYPPFWWRYVTRPLEKPELMDWFPNKGDNF